MSEPKGPVLPFPTVTPDPNSEMNPDRRNTVGQLESLLFAAGDAVSEAELARALEREDIGEMRQCLFLLQAELEHSNRGVVITRVGSRWQMQTATSHKAIVTRLLGARPKKLSRAALEVLSIVAYQQPITRHEVDEIRGVDSAGVVKSLMNREVIRVVGRRAIPGRPLEYGTTRGFLELFGLADLRSLPTLREYEELAMDTIDES